MVDIPILYDDEHLLVADKPSGLLVVPAPRRSEPTLLDRLSQQMCVRLLAVHRLDEGTTGAILFAKTDPVRAALEEQFRRHAIERDYLALVTGRPSPPSGRIESGLRETGGVVEVVRQGGQRAVTVYESLSRRGRFTLVRCRLETGRRNQIRVHMSALGCPLAGDRKYGFRVRHGEAFQRPMLHSWRLRFVHPVGSRAIVIETPPRESELEP